MSLLGIDIGNTTVGFAIMDGPNVVDSVKVSSKLATKDYRQVFLDFFNGHKLDKAHFEGCVISSVVPSCFAIMKPLFDYFFPGRYHLISYEKWQKANTIFSIDTEDPKQMGADLFAMAVGAHTEYQRPTLVVGCGSAFTVTLVTVSSISNVFIAPGVNMSLSALCDRAELLPKIEMSVTDKPSAKNTQDAVNIGTYIGFQGLLTALIAKGKEWLARDLKVDNKDILVIGTGGDSHIFKDVFDKLDENLIYKGMWHFYNNACR